MKFSRISAEAQEEAINRNQQIVVFQDLDCRWWNKVPKYDYCNKITFDWMVKSGKYALIRLLLIQPNGVIVQ